MRLTALLSILALISTLLIIVPAAGGSDQSEIIEALEDFSEVVKSELPKDAFANLNSADGRRGALCNKIRAVIHKVNAGAYESAVNKLKNDIRKHIINWIADEEWEADLLDMVDEIIDLIEGVLPPNLPPVAKFTESAETVLTSVVINFDASESYDPDGYIASYFWDFGDENNATGMTVAHAYADDGVYTVVLTVTDDDGATASANATKTVMNRSPVAIFTESAESVPTGEIIYFNASDSHDPDGYIVSYFWDFGDETYATGVTADHSYTEEGTYTVTLTVTDDDGATASADATKIAGNRSPVANFTESAEIVLTSVAIDFDASSSHDPDGYIASYFWDFGDENNATGVTADHAYTDDGVYIVALTVTDNDGATSTATSTKIVLNRPPVASFTENATTVLTGEVISFDASDSDDADGSIVSYVWDFGDEVEATGVTVTHVYADDGVYTVTLTVTDDDEATASANAVKIVSNRPPVASFTENATTVLTGEVISFDAFSSEDPDGYIISYLWDFGDETTAVDVEVNHAYEDDGVYTVTLTVTDDDGATASTSTVKTVSNRPPIAYFIENATTVKEDEVIHFDASGSHDLDGNIVSYFWDFGDETNATGVTADHSYAEDGNYTVILTVTDDDGASSSMSDAKTVEALAAAGWPLALLAAIGLGIAALTATLLYGLYRRRKKKRTASNPGSKPVVTLYVPTKLLIG